MNQKKENTEIHYEYKKQKGKALPITIIAIVILGIASFLYVFKDDILEGIKDGPQNNIKDSEMIVEKDFVSGLRLAAIDKYDEAISHFENIKFEKLSDSDKFIVLNTYLQTDQEQTALNLDREFDEDIIKKYLKNDEIEKLKELDSDSKLIEFEIAVLDNDYEKIIKLKDVKGLEKDERRANAIANAFYKLGQKEEAVKFTSLMTLDGINMWSLDTKVNNSKMSSDDNKLSDSLSWSVYFYISLMILLILGAIGYFYNKKKVNEKKISKSKDVAKDDFEDEKYSYHYDETNN